MCISWTFFPTKNNRNEEALQCAPLLGTESPLPRLACSHLLEKSQLRHLSNSPTCIRRHCQPICRVSQGKCQKLIDDLREEYFTLLPFLCQMSFYSFRSPRHPSFPTCIGQCQPGHVVLQRGGCYQLQGKPAMRFLDKRNLRREGQLSTLLCSPRP